MYKWVKYMQIMVVTCSVSYQLSDIGMHNQLLIEQTLSIFKQTHFIFKQTCSERKKLLKGEKL